MHFAKPRTILIEISKIVLGIFLLFLAIRQVDWIVFGDALKSVDFHWFMLALFSILLGLAIKLLRWLLLLRNFGVSRPFNRIFASFFLGQAANILFFIRGGEVVRIGWLSSSKKSDLGAITTSVIFEKYLDLVLLVILMVTVSTNLPEVAVGRLVFLKPILVTLTIILLAAILVGPWIWQKISDQKEYSGWRGNLQNKINQLIQACLWLRKPSLIVPVFGYTLFIWFIMVCSNLLLFRAFNINTGWDAAGLVVVLVYIGVLPALMPGNIGPFTFFAQLALIPFDVESSVALAFAILLYGIVTLPPLIISGLMFLIPKFKFGKST
jgi:uncharacterized protein (TIRG00374 family)